MKNLNMTFLIIVLFCMVGERAFAHDIEVANADGATIYYNYTNDGKELAVTYRGDSFNDYFDEYFGNIVIPEEVVYQGRSWKVTSIGSDAFMFCTRLTSVTIPNYVKSIGSSAFNYCFGLTSIVIPNSVTIIGDETFYNCSGLTSVTIPNSVTSIGKWAFQNCSNLCKLCIFL